MASVLALTPCSMLRIDVVAVSVRALDALQQVGYVELVAGSGGGGCVGPRWLSRMQRTHRVHTGYT